MRRCALVATFCLAVLPASAQDKAEFQKIADSFVQAYAKGDLNAVLQLYAQDAYVLPPQAPMAKGQSSIAEFWKGEASEPNSSRLPLSMPSRSGTTLRM